MPRAGSRSPFVGGELLVTLSYPVVEQNQNLSPVFAQRILDHLGSIAYDTDRLVVRVPCKDGGWHTQVLKDRRGNFVPGVCPFSSPCEITQGSLDDNPADLARWADPPVDFAVAAEARRVAQGRIEEALG